MFNKLITKFRSLNAKGKVDSAIHVFNDTKNMLTEAVEELEDLNQSSNDEIDELSLERDIVYNEYTKKISDEYNTIEERKDEIRRAEALRDKVTDFLEV